MLGLKQRYWTWHKGREVQKRRSRSLALLQKTPLRRFRPQTAKIVCVGLGKTGTTTFGHCMRHLGFRHYNAVAHAAAYRDLDMEVLTKVIDRHDSFDDFPWPYLYKYIDENYAGSKFVLTRRKNADIWFTSLCRHYDRTGPTLAKKIFYGFYSPYEDPNHHKSLYETHCDAIRRYFAGRSDFLDVCWEDGDGWGELCTFLNLPVPDIPFPHANAAPKNFDYAAARRDADEKMAALQRGEV